MFEYAESPADEQIECPVGYQAFNSFSCYGEMIVTSYTQRQSECVCVCVVFHPLLCFMCVCVLLGEKEETALPVSRTCSAEMPPPLNLASSTITAYPEIITEAPSPTKRSELAGIQTEVGSGGRKTSDLATLLEVGSPPSFPGHRHSKSMDGKSSFK